MTSIVIPGLSAVIFINTLIQLWYFQPYENIFKDLMPGNFCTAMLTLVSTLVVLQMLGARAGNCESTISVNVYMILQTIFVILLMTQWSFVLNQYQQFQQDMYTDPSEIANLMTYVHHEDFKFIIGGVGPIGTQGNSYMSCPSGKYKDHLSSSNLYELKCPKRDLIRMKWDVETTDKAASENLYACLNVECQDQFKAWIDSLVYIHLLLSGLLVLCCLFSIHLAYLMKDKYTD
jgi:hypothetical protein